MRNILLTSTCMALMVCAAHAQNAPSPAGRADAASGPAGARDPSQGPPASPDIDRGRGKLEEIIVTAQKVRQNVQRTPIAIQTLSGRTIANAGVDNAKDLNRLVSSLSVQVSAGGGSSFFIRGVGSDNGNALTDNGVAVSLDQVYFSRAYGPDLAFYDLDRIEVLKGPQGTLYGRNATGGAINIISTKPTIGNFDGYARLEFGDYGEIKSNAAVNFPITPTLAARIAIQTDQHDGYLTDGYDDTDSKGVRAHLLWKPNADLSLLISGEYDHAGGRGQEGVNYTGNHFLTSNPYEGGNSPAAIAFVNNNARTIGSNLGTPLHFFSGPGSCYPGCIPPGFIQSNANSAFHPYQVTDNGYVNTTIQSFRADLEYNLGFGTLSVIPAVLNTYYSTIFHNGPAPFFNDGSAQQQSLEVRIASPQDQRLTWLAGLFGQHEQQNFAFIGGFGAPFAYQGSFQPDVQDRAAGAFAQTTFKITPALSLITGLRYSIEDKVNYNAAADNAAIIPIPGLFVHSVAPVNKEHSESPTFRIGLDWQAAPDNFLYVSFATGFHSGGLQLGQPPKRAICKPVLSGTLQQFEASVSNCDAVGTYRPEYLKAYTIGSKNRFFDNQFQLNLEAYDWEYQDLQVGTLGLSNPNQTNQVTTNAGAARIRGFDVEARAQITPNDEASIALNYNNSRYGTLFFFNYIVNTPFPPSISNYSGLPFQNAPDLTFTAHYQHVFDLANGATLVPSVSMQYSSTVDYSIAPVESQPSYYKIDLALNYQSPNDRYEVGLFVRNLNDAVTLNSSAGNDSVSNEPYVYIAAPRTFGGSLMVRF